MGIETVAECVETVEQVEAMRHAGVTAVQGFLLAHPMAVDDATAWLARHARGVGSLPATRREADVSPP